MDEPEKLKPFGIEAARLRFKMRPYEIATLYLDIVPGRKQFRDLDAKREVWATVHREKGDALRVTGGDVAVSLATGHAPRSHGP